MSNFMNSLKNEMLDGQNYSVTENGAVGYRTTGRELLDLNFSVASLRKAAPNEIADRFIRAFFEGKLEAMKWLFFARDVRGGMGERRLFRAILLRLALDNPEYVRPVLRLVPEYGRWDDLWCLLDTPLRSDVVDLVAEQLDDDIRGKAEVQPISVLAKWMPRTRTSSEQTRHYAKLMRDNLEMSNRAYQHTLADLTRYLLVVEQKMSFGAWDEIDYRRVPSRANMIYNDAFLRHDETRRREFLDSVSRGEEKINAGTLFPHEIVNRYRSKAYDEALEQLWKALPDTVQGCGNTIVVQDDSGSMTWVTLPDSSARPLEVANALAIYFAERSSGQFKDKFLTFSEKPELIDLSGGKNLREKLQIVNSCHVGASTNVEAVFDLILQTAVNRRMEQSELPQNVLVISDMEFNACATAGMSRGMYGHMQSVSARLFDEISKRYNNAGYKMPRLVFWNVASRTGTIPVRENDMGVALVSGFSPNVARMVMSGKLDPYECMMETLNSPRYDAVEAALRVAIKWQPSL